MQKELKTYTALFFYIFLELFIKQDLLSQLTVNGNIRSRIECRYGQGALPDSSCMPAFFVNQRTRLSLKYNNHKYSVGLTFQDSRVWGDTEPKKDNNPIGIREGWILYNFNQNLSLQFGRQILSYDDQRLLSESNWNNRGTSHDIAVLRYENEDKYLRCHIGMAVNNSKEDRFLSDYNLDFYKYLSYIWVDKELANGLSLSFIDIADANQKSGKERIVYLRNTVGTNLEYKTGKLNSQGILYLQHGSTGTGKEVLANFLSVKYSYNISSITGLILGFDHYSGTDMSDTTKYERKTTSFSKLYGSNHRFLGYMDYFTGDIASENYGAGINNLYFRINNSITRNIKVQATYHWFSLDKAYLTPEIKVDKYLGSEFDFMLIFKNSDDITLTAGYSFMIPNSTLEVISDILPGHSKFAQFGWIQLVFSPSFLINNHITN